MFSAKILLKENLQKFNTLQFPNASPANKIWTETDQLRYLLASKLMLLATRRSDFPDNFFETFSANNPTIKGHETFN